jgi:hypothetical protein
MYLRAAARGLWSRNIKTNFTAHYRRTAMKHISIDVSFFFPIMLYSSCIAYDEPSYLLDDFSGFPLCFHVDPLP